MKINITGATGSLGNKITQEALLQMPPEQIILSVRNPKKLDEFVKQGVTVRKSDYNNVEEMIEAFQDTDVLIYIPSSSFPNPIRIEEFENSVHAAEKANVKHLIFVGFAADHENNPFTLSPCLGYAARRLASSNLHYTLVRNVMYADPLLSYLPELIQRGCLVYPAGEGKISFISKTDIAKAIIQLAFKPQLYGGRYTLTGQKAYSMIELSEILSETSGVPIKYNPMSIKEFSSTYDEPKGFGEILCSMYVAAQKNLMDEVTDDFQLITGETAEDIRSFLARNYKRKVVAKK